MSFPKIMDIDGTNELKNRTWWWWWLIFFLKNRENLDRPKQLMILWGTRNTDFVEVSDVPWRRRFDIQREGNHLTFYGMCSSWFYDGSKMIEPLFADQGTMTSDWNEEEGVLVLKNDNTYSFAKKGDDYIISIERPGLEVEMKISPWTHFLSRIAPTGKTYLANLGYQMHKIRGSRASGRIVIDGTETEEEGTAYFQKVRINSPTSPWYWGVFHTESGCYVDYFMPHMGPPALRRSYGHQSRLDWGERTLSKSWQFYDPSDGEFHRIKKISMRKTYENDLPTFTLRGREENRSIEMVMKAYSRACWKVKQPFLRYFCTYLYYNEYPVNVVKFDFRCGQKTRTLSDVGRFVGNCEHSWGII
ncbi:MAG: hypothetical protein KAW84_03480 [Thermoplasmata archaeon]|nr:hypothetical protein [Thermoplasmata archaeon]